MVRKYHIDNRSFAGTTGHTMSMRRRCLEAGLEADTHAAASVHSEATHLANFFLVLPGHRPHLSYSISEEKIASEMEEGYPGIQNLGSRSVGWCQASGNSARDLLLHHEGWGWWE